jgi:hypothetical protein
MATDSEYMRRIQTYGWQELQEMWSQIQERQTPDWAPGKAFEYLLLRAFELEGAEVVFPYSVNFNNEIIEQIDGVVHSGHLDCLLEAKDWAGKNVNVEPVAKMRSQLQRRAASTIGVVFSSGGFTEAALTLTRFVTPQTVLLWSGSEVAAALEKQSFRDYLLYKYRRFVHTGDPTIDARLRDLP